MFKICLQNSY